MAAPRLSAIPEPQKNIDSMYEAIVALKQIVEVLAGQRGDATGRAATFRELVNIGLIEEDEIP